MFWNKLNRLCIILVLLCGITPDAVSQSFDLRPQSNSSKKADESVLTLLEKNDVSGMRSYLKRNKQAANSNSRVITTASGAKIPVPLFFDAVSSALYGEKGSPEMCQAIIDAGCDLHPVFDGKTPIYLLMDYFATHKKNQCEVALKILRAFDSRSDWDANQRYRSELPPMNYLIRTNYEYLNQRFSREYIADDVLKILLDHGASVTSYTDKGQTLMTFAMDTDNQFLQTYLVEKGVNLMHQDDSGHDDLYRMVETGNLAVLQKAYQQGTVQINVHTVKNDARDMARHRDVYDFVTGVCADQARTYEDITLFRSRFADKFPLVRGKYENLARAETNAANDFDAINLVVQRYPDLDFITKDKRLQIYHNDAAAVEAAYKTAYSAAQNRKTTNIGSLRNLNDFIDNYGKRGPYDPENMVPKAKKAVDFQDVCYGINMRVASVYHGEEYAFTALLLNKPYYFDRKEAQRDTATMGRAIRAAHRGMNEDRDVFTLFYEDNIDALYRKQSQLFDSINKSIEFVNEQNTAAVKKHRRQMCEACKVDGSRSTFPKGYVEAYRGIFFSSPAESETEGELSLKNGESCYWKYVFEPTGTIIVVRGRYPGTFSSVEEMVTTILQKCNEYWGEK